MKKPFAIAAALLTVTALSGCMAERFSDLEREATSADVLPAGVDDSKFEDARHVGTYDGADFYIAKSLERRGDVCVAVVASDTPDWIISCGLGTTVGGAGIPTATIVPDGTPAPEGWTLVGENIHAQ